MTTAVQFIALSEFSGLMAMQDVRFEMFFFPDVGMRTLRVTTLIPEEVYVMAEAVDIGSDEEPNLLPAGTVLNVRTVETRKMRKERKIDSKIHVVHAFRNGILSYIRGMAQIVHKLTAVEKVKFVNKLKDLDLLRVFSWTAHLWGDEGRREFVNRVQAIAEDMADDTSPITVIARQILGEVTPEDSLGRLNYGKNLLKIQNICELIETKLERLSRAEKDLLARQMTAALILHECEGVVELVDRVVTQVLTSDRIMGVQTSNERRETTADRLANLAAELRAVHVPAPYAGFVHRICEWLWHATSALRESDLQQVENVLRSVQIECVLMRMQSEVSEWMLAASVVLIGSDGNEVMMPQHVTALHAHWRAVTMRYDSIMHRSWRNGSIAPWIVLHSKVHLFNRIGARLAGVRVTNREVWVMREQMRGVLVHPYSV